MLNIDVDKLTIYYRYYSYDAVYTIYYLDKLPDENFTRFFYNHRKVIDLMDVFEEANLEDFKTQYKKDNDKDAPDIFDEITLDEFADYIHTRFNIRVQEFLSEPEYFIVYPSVPEVESPDKNILLHISFLIDNNSTSNRTEALNSYIRKDIIAVVNSNNIKNGIKSLLKDYEKKHDVKIDSIDDIDSYKEGINSNITYSIIDTSRIGIVYEG